jgi:hypothetical protein
MHFNRVFIPDENLVWCPEKLLTAVLAHTHYLPDSYRGQAHTNRVRDEFSQLFHYKAVSSQFACYRELKCDPNESIKPFILK